MDSREKKRLKELRDQVIEAELKEIDERREREKKQKKEEDEAAQDQHMAYYEARVAELDIEAEADGDEEFVRDTGDEFVRD